MACRRSLVLRDVVGWAEVVPGSQAEPILCLNDRVGLALRGSGGRSVANKGGN